jgi:FtsZ-binding cell division protein ZapB
MFKKNQRVLSEDLSVVELQRDEIQQLKAELEDFKKKCENVEKELENEKTKNEKLKEENEKLKEELLEKKPKEEQKKNGIFSFKKSEDQLMEVNYETTSGGSSGGGFSIFKKKVPSVNTTTTTTLESTSLDEKKNNSFFSKFSPRSNSNTSNIPNSDDMEFSSEPKTKNTFSLFKKKKSEMNEDFDNPFNEEDFSNTTHKKSDHSRDSFGVDFENQSFL